MENLILETDFNYDFDDVGALAMLLCLMHRGEANILAIMANAPDPHVAPSIQAMTTYYGRSEIPIGQTSANYPIDLWDNYNKQILREYPATLEPGKAPEAVELYREILGAQPDQSLKILSIGFMNNLARLMQNPADIELVRRKVKELVIMVGGFPHRREIEPSGKDTFNFSRDFAGAAGFIKYWPTPITASTVGKNVLTGLRLTTESRKEFITRRLFELWKENTDGGIYNQPDYNRSSWDQVCALYTVRGIQDNFEFVGRNGSVELSFENTKLAHLKWSSEPRGNWSYITALKQDEMIAKEIEELMLFDPQACGTEKCGKPS
jgi:inosine-uridine nucleoside N-ribohydrolase